MSRGIRRYGPGKFNTIVDSVIYGMVNSGMGNESIGDVSEIGFYAESILLGPDAVKDAEDEAKEFAPHTEGELTKEEKDLIRESYAAIMVENEQGFVSVDYYDTKKEYEDDWKQLEEEASGEPEDEEGDEGDEEEEEEEESEETESEQEA